MPTKNRLVVFAILGTAALAGCGSKTDANEKNFGVALTHYFEKKGTLCLKIKRWPMDVTEMDLRLKKDMQSGIAAQMSALETVGLAKSEDIDVDRVDFMGKPIGVTSRIKRYTLTDAAQPFMHSKDVDSIGLAGKTTVKQTDLCWGNNVLDKIVKWEGPIKLGDYQEASVTYTYKVSNIADWTKRAEIQTAFPFVKTVLDGVGIKESKHSIKLTSQGWEARGLD